MDEAKRIALWESLIAKTKHVIDPTGTRYGTFALGLGNVNVAAWNSAELLDMITSATAIHANADDFEYADYTEPLNWYDEIESVCNYSGCESS